MAPKAAIFVPVSIESLEAPHTLIENKPHSQWDALCPWHCYCCHLLLSPIQRRCFKSLDTLESLWLIAERWSLGWHQEARESICLSLILPQAYATLARVSWVQLVQRAGGTMLARFPCLHLPRGLSKCARNEANITHLFHSILLLCCIRMASAKPTGFRSECWKDERCPALCVMVGNWIY